MDVSRIDKTTPPLLNYNFPFKIPTSKLLSVHLYLEEARRMSYHALHLRGKNVFCATGRVPACVHSHLAREQSWPTVLWQQVNVSDNKRSFVAVPASSKLQMASRCPDMFHRAAHAVDGLAHSRIGGMAKGLAKEWCTLRQARRRMPSIQRSCVSSKTYQKEIQSFPTNLTLPHIAIRDLVAMTISAIVDEWFKRRCCSHVP